MKEAAAIAHSDKVFGQPADIVVMNCEPFQRAGIRASIAA